MAASASSDDLENAFLCIAKLDESLELADGSTPSLFNLDCCSGDCNSCGFEQIGWGRCEAEFGELRRLEKDEDGEPILFNYRQYMPMPRGKDKKTKKEKFQDELVPVKGTRLEFMELLKLSIERFLLHHFKDRWSFVQRARMRMSLLDNELLISSDFASVFKFENKFTSTCDHPSSATCCVAIVQHSPTLMEVEVTKQDAEMEQSTIGDAVQLVAKYGETLKEKEVRRVLKTNVVRAYSNRKGVNCTFACLYTHACSLYIHMSALSSLSRHELVLCR